MKTYIEPVTGYRAWRPINEDGEPRLRSAVMSSMTWPVGGSVSARCTWCPHGAPSSGCVCGIHALADSTALLRRFGWSMYVLGEVEMWGKIIRHESGFRAERARVSAIYIHRTDATKFRNAEIERRARLLADTYEVPILYAALESVPVLPIPTR